MVQLNLLPEALQAKRKEKVDWEQVPVVPFVVSVVVFLVVFQILSVFLVTRNTLILNGVKKKWEKLKPKKEEITVLHKKANQYSSKIDAMKELTENRIEWAKILSGISSSVLPNIWYSKLSYDNEKDGFLILEGFAMGGSEMTTASIGRQIDALKNDPEFSIFFDNIELDSMRRSLIDKKEVMNFQFKCKSRPKQKIVKGKDE
ncbi:MAG: hypothetical protein PHQ52_01045 [Candidatus Omnitrophica bacterium]|nr:hypothetical protein [Candidatus Omnitrophota bacterium]